MVLKGQSFIDRILAHKLLLATSLILSGCGLVLGASLQLTAALVLVSILPGYLLSMAIGELTDVERVITAAPLSMILVGALALVPNILFGLNSVDGILVIALDIALLGWIALKEHGKTTLEPLKTQAIVLSLLVLAFFMSVNLVGFGTLSHPANTMVFSLDSVVQYVSISWMAATHGLTAPPSINPFYSGLYNSYAIPVSFVSQALITQLSGANYWDANEYFIVLVFIETALSTFLLFRKLVNEEAGALAAFAVIFPFFLNFTYPYYFGLWRVVFSLMLTPIVIYYAIKCINNEGMDSWILALLLLLFALTQPLTAGGIVMSTLIVAVYALLNSKALERFIAPAVVSALLFVTIMLPLLPVLLPGGSGYPLKSGQILSLNYNVETEFAYTVGGTLIAFNSIPWWIPLTAILGLALYWLDSLKEFSQQKNSLKDWLGFGPLHITFGTLLIFIASTGVLTFLSEYALKSRFNLFLNFLVPLVAVSFLLVLSKVGEYLQFRQKTALLAVCFVAILALSQPWAYAFPTPAGSLIAADSSQVTHPILSWDVIDYLRQNTSTDSRILFFGFTQYTGALSERRSFEITPEIAINQSLENNYSRYFDAQPVCFTGSKQLGFLDYAQGSCNATFDNTNICNYDYIVVGNFPYSQYTNYTQYSNNLIQKLQPTFQIVAQKGICQFNGNCMFTILKRAQENQSCLPAN